MSELFEGEVVIQDGSSRDVFRFDSRYAALYIGASGNEGDIIVRDGSGREVFKFDSNHAVLYLGATGNEGDLIMRDGSGRDVIHLDSNNAVLYVGASGNEGDIIVRDGSGRHAFHLDSNHAALYVGATGNEGDLFVRDGNGRNVFHFDSNHAALYLGATGNEGDLFVRDSSGNNRIHLDGNSGDIKLSGADCAEEFDVVADYRIDPGTVLVIDEDSRLSPCEIPYDKRVAGVVSGANGYRPGIILGKDAAPNARVPIALNGKVYCKAEAQISPIEVGDLLTTSATRGHAMKAADHSRAFGTVIGKALGGLREGQGFIPVLVSLQ